MHSTTENLNLAAYLLATDSLRLLECKLTRPYRVGFVFDDPDNQLVECELDFERGKPVSAQAIFASLKYLRRLMTECLDEYNIKTHGF